MRAGTFLTEEIERGPAGPKVGAFFDVDGTLLSGFSGMAFWRDRLLSGQMSAADLSENALAWVGFQRGQIGFSGILAAWSGMLRGTPERELAETGERLFNSELAALVFPESRALVEAHLRRGHTVAIVSAATRYQIDPLARDLGIERVLCTRLEVDDGHFTGRFVRPACWGEGKADAVRALAAEEGLDLAQSYFYTDAAEDLPLLELVGRPRPTNPDRRLTRIAERRIWPVRRFASRGRPSFADVVRTALATASSGLALALGLPLALITGRPKAALDFALGAWGDLGTALAGIELRVRGEEHLWSSRPCVFIFNHQSSLDVLPKSGLVVRPATVDVVVLPPISTRDWTRESLDEHIEDVRQLYEEVLAG